MIKTLIVEDDAPLRHLLKLQLEELGFRVDEAEDLKTAGRKLRQESYEVILLDMVLPDGTSISLLDKFPAQTAGRTIVITANPSIPGVVECIKKGAYNYLEKPIEPEVLELQVHKVVELGRLKAEHQTMSVEMVSDFSFDNIVYQSREMEDVVNRAKVLAGTTNSILIHGETGVGKEVLSHAIHNHSARKDEVFLPLNCAAIPEELFESELFGYEKGAFTGATSSYNGRFLQADKGTLFLDEIGELPLTIQAKLLRILDERKIYRLRSTVPQAVDVRLVAATNRDLRQEIKARQFRGDLYYRLQESCLTIPPLREREEDILPLFRHFIKIYSQLYKKEVLHISREAEHCLVNHRWEGNVRELKNTVKSTIPFKTTNTIELEDISPLILDTSTHSRDKLVTLEEMENRYILKVLKITGFNISRTAEILKISRTRIYRKLEQFDLEVEAGD